MLSIKLINMPFASFIGPSIALTQIQSVLEARFGDAVDVEILHLNHEFAAYLEPDVYNFIADSAAGHFSGFGEWFFTASAFPEEEDNTEDFFERYGIHFGEEGLALYENRLKKKRANLDLYLEVLIEKFEIDEADVVGFTSMFFQTLPSYAMARKLKELNPDITTVMGGANCEAPMGRELARQLEDMDFIFSGPGLVSFTDFIANTLAGDLDERADLTGVFCADNDPNPQQAIGGELDLDSPVPLDYDSFFQSFDTHFKGTEYKPYLFFETSRGCWWGQRSHCTFCGLNGGSMAYRSMQADNAVHMIQDLIDRYGDRIDHMAGVDNIMPKNYFQEVFPRLKVPDHLSFFYEVKADLTAAQMQVLAEAHVFHTQPGIEALSTPTLKLMRKGTTSFNNIVFLMHSRTYGIRPAWNLLMGFPGETEEVYLNYLANMKLLTHLQPPSGAVTVRFDRFSPYFNSADKFDLELEPLDFYNLIFPFEADSVRRLAFYFSDHNYEAPYIQLVGRYVQPIRQEVEAWQALWEDADQVPELYYHDNGVFDSRDGNPKIIALKPETVAILKTITRAKTPKRLVRECDGLTSDQVEAGLAEAKQHGLLFTEKDSFISVVFENKPAPIKRKAIHL